MALYHFTTKAIARKGYSKSAVAACAYRTGESLHDSLQGRVFDFTKRNDVVDVRYIVPDTGAHWLKALVEAPHLSKKEKIQHICDVVESCEKRSDSRVYREIECALPKELTLEKSIPMAEDFFHKHFTKRGIGGIMSTHDKGEGKPHVHMLLFTRTLTDTGFGLKDRSLDTRAFLKEIRAAWAEHVNDVLKEEGLDIRIDHRSYKDQGLALLPFPKLGAAFHQALWKGCPEIMERYELYKSTLFQNQCLIQQDPSLVMKALSQQKTVVSEEEIRLFVGRYFSGDTAESVTERVIGHINTVCVDEERYTRREFVMQERDLMDMARDHQQRCTPLLSEAETEALLEKGTAYGAYNEEQRALIFAMAQGKLWVNGVGFAGTGKTSTLQPVCEALKEKGVEILGLAPTGKAAEGLKSMGIRAMTIDAFLIHHEHGKEQKSSKHQMILLDEAGMVDTKRFHALAHIVTSQQRNFVALGDPRQLTPIEAGRPFERLLKECTTATLTDVVRQKDPLHKEATQAMGQGDMEKAWHFYKTHHVCMEKGADATQTRAVMEWWKGIKVDTLHHIHDHIMVGHTNACVETLNHGARVLLKHKQYLYEQGVTFLTKKITSDELGQTQVIRQDKEFCRRERVMFLKNDKGLGVMNGNRGTVTDVDNEKIAVRLDDNRLVSFSPRLYPYLDHGYAVSIHKSQGMTVSTCHVMMEKTMNASLTYVALSRHRDAVMMYANTSDFPYKSSLKYVFNKDKDSLDPDLSAVKMEDLSRTDPFVQKVKDAFETLKFGFKSLVFSKTPQDFETKDPLCASPYEKAALGRALGDTMKAYDTMSAYKEDSDARRAHSKDLMSVVAYKVLNEHSSLAEHKQVEMLLHHCKEKYVQEFPDTTALHHVVRASIERVVTLFSMKKAYFDCALKKGGISVYEAKDIAFMGALCEAKGHAWSVDDAKHLCNRVNDQVAEVAKEVPLSAQAKALLFHEIVDTLFENKDHDTSLKDITDMYEERAFSCEKNTLEKEEDLHEDGFNDPQRDCDTRPSWIERAHVLQELCTQKEQDDTAAMQRDIERIHSRGMEM
jgi:Ti-type conjugative transfer relaxase TraA